MVKTGGQRTEDGWRRLYSFEPNRFITPDGAGMSFLDEGPRGDTAVLMLHGNPTWSFYYRNLVVALAPTMRCIAPDHVGMGLSEKPEQYPYTLAGRIADIEALVASLGLKRIHLVVHDWGGAIGFGFAVRHPELIGRIVILNTAAFPAPHIPLRIAVCRAPLIGTPLVRGLNGFAGPAVRMAMSRTQMDAGRRAGYLFPYRTWRDRVAIDAFVRGIPMDSSHPSWTELNSIAGKLPLFRSNQKLIVWGGRDFCFNDYFYNRWLEIFPEAQRQYIADAGHYVLEDAEEAVPNIAGFLKRPT